MNILLIRSGGLGDSILTLAVALRLRERYPDAALHLLGNPTMRSVGRLTGLFESVRSLDGAGFAALFSGGGATPFLRSYLSSFDTVYCFSAGEPGGIVHTVLDSGARNCRVLDPRPPIGWTRHITDHFLSILGREETGPARLPEPTAVSGLPRRKDLLVIHPGSGGRAKTWPLERFLAVAGMWPGETVFLLGPAELERGYASGIPGRYRCVSDPPLEQAAALLSGAGAFLGNDSGASHLAALCGTPAVVLFGPTDPRVWRPPGARVTVVASPDGSMEGIGVDEVLRALGYQG